MDYCCDKFKDNECTVYSQKETGKWVFFDINEGSPIEFDEFDYCPFCGEHL